MHKLILSTVLASLVAMPAFSYSAANPLHPALIRDLTGANGQYNSAKQFKVSIPRHDLTIVVNGVTLSAGMGLTSTATFQKNDNDTSVRGDVVVTENQVNAVMSSVLKKHLSVVALHNHFLWESPKVMFLHFEGQGREKDLAKAVGQIFATVKDTSYGKGEFPVATLDASTTTFNAHRMNQILGANGRIQDEAYIVQIRNLAKNHKITNALNINTTAKFAGSDAAAVVDGDFALPTQDLSNVLSELHKAGISVVALHQQPGNNAQGKLVFLHYWGVGPAATLAKGIRTALNKIQDNDIAMAQAASIDPMNAMTYLTALPNGAKIPDELLVSRSWCLNSGA